jgi:rare lipoprotein A
MKLLMKPYRLRLPLLLLAATTYLAGCSSTPPQKTTQRGVPSEVKSAPVKPPYKGGGYYKDDGPGAVTPANLDAVADAIPTAEPLHAFANNPYRVLGKSYTPLTTNVGYKVDGKASWYGRKFHGKPTSSGEPYDMYAMTAAHPVLPIPSFVRVTNSENGKSVVVRINDRGPFHDNRLIDLSYTAAYKLDVLKGVTPVTVEAVLPETAPTSFVAQASEEVVEPTTQPVTLVVGQSQAAPVVQPASAYYLQLGAFSSEARANELLDRITARLSRTFPGVLRLAVDGLYKVQAGPFTTPGEADQAATLLREQMGLKTFKVVSEPRPAGVEAVMPAPAEQPSSASTPGQGLYLQLAAVSSPAAAETLGNKIKSRYGAELPGLSQVQLGSLYKVQAGPFATPAAAARLSMAYQQDFGVKPYQVTR